MIRLDHFFVWTLQAFQNKQWWLESIFVSESPEVVSLGPPGGLVTLVEGSTFSISGRSGDIRPGSAQGFFFQDARHLSQFEIRLDGQETEPLSVAIDEPFAATFVSRARPRPGRADSTIVVFRRRRLSDGLTEEVEIRNFGDETVTYRVDVKIDADFAHVFAVKEGRVQVTGEFDRFIETHQMGVHHRDGSTHRSVVAEFTEPAQVSRGFASFDAVIEPASDWKMLIEVSPLVSGKHVGSRHDEETELHVAGERFSQWRRHVPVLDTDYAPLAEAVNKGKEDLGSLRIFGNEFPDGAVIAAGAPWYMALFGRDSLITAWMALLVDPDLSLGVLEALARYQGTEVNPRTDEEPGRILHEVRSAHSADFGFEDSKVYYGSADSSPLFVMLLGELRRWGLAPGLVARLLPHADRALDWIENFGDRDGDGYVEYERATDTGIRNQAWKDSNDAVRYADGRLATTPIAIAEVQAYTYAAYQARRYFAQEEGDVAKAEHFARKAHDLQVAFNRDFWIEDGEYFAIALDADKTPVDGVASNMGHCLWTGIVDQAKAPAIAKKLISPQMFSGWGIRTLSSDMVGYNPIGYHIGSVWPHDSTIAAAGLMRYGFVEEAQQVIIAILEAAATHGGRLPELYSGIDRSDLSTTVSFPTSCSPQAWAAASPLLALRSLLRFEPSIPQGQLYLAPVLPKQIRRLSLQRIPLNGRRIVVEVEGDYVEVSGLGDDVQVINDPASGRSGREIEDGD